MSVPILSPTVNNNTVDALIHQGARLSFVREVSGFRSKTPESFVREVLF